MSKSYNFKMQEAIRKLSLDERYIDLVDTQFPYLLSLTPSGINWNWDGSDNDMKAHVVAFKEQLRKVIDLAFELNVSLSGSPRQPYNKLLLSVGLVKLSYGTELRVYRRDWQGVMAVLTLNGKSDTWRRPQVDDNDWKDIWTAFQTACLVESKIVETFETDLPF